MLMLIVAVTICLLFFQKPAELFRVSFQQETGIVEIKLWKDDQDCYHVFLPGSMSADRFRIILKTESDIYIDEQKLSNGFSCGAFRCDVPYNMEYTQFGLQRSSSIVFHRSGTIATMFLQTESGSMEYVHEKKDNKETGEVVVFSNSGNLDYTGEIEYIKGRGNYTWEASEKKPYNIFLTEAAELLSMGKGNKWVLLANSSDVSQMRNKMVYDFAQKIGLEYAPDSQWVELYLNGEYRGLYLLSEAVEIGADRVDISVTEGVIIGLETEDILLKKNETYFLTDAGVPVEIRTPIPSQDSGVDDLRTRVQFVENALLSESSDLLQNAIDVDSWVKKYLVDEVFGNLDAFVRSAYFYYDGHSDKLFAGPVWDYDMSAGNEYEWSFGYANTFFAYRPARMVGYDTPWIYNLCQKEAFWNQAAETYRLEFMPELDRLIQTTIFEYEARIRQAAELDDIRWRNAELRFEDSVSTLQEYMVKRIGFLTEIWSEGREYHVVQARQSSSGSYSYYIVYPGETLSFLPEFEDTNAASFAGWFDQRTGEQVDPTAPVTQDMMIYTKWKEYSTEKVDRILKMVPVGIIAILGVGLLVADVRKNRKL